MHKLPEHDRVLFEPKKTPAFRIYAVVADKSTAQVVVHNAGNGVVSIDKNQELGRFQSMNPDVRVYTVDVAAQPAASDLALVTKDHDEKHLLLSEQVIREETAAVHPETNEDCFDSGDASERRQIEGLLREYSQVFADKGFARVPGCASR
ncbi:hypothetical protein E4U56_007800 [Claviceps arundinis]|uniref:Uncharacterized protein n=2 Tax=Claviceps arundinis TaxID=1623583 RepID=A0A9P7MZ62_9HYPO|nr:hypothetical protein E4U56_007800 [Claviceps arundinis]